MPFAKYSAFMSFIFLLTFTAPQNSLFSMRQIKQTCSIVAILLIAMSCRQQKELVYFTDLQEAEIQNNTLEEQKDYKIRANDILYIKMMSLDENINALFDAATAGGTIGTRFFTEDAMYFTGYSVSYDGFVDLPVVGNIAVLGKTIDEAKSAVRAKAAEYINDAVVLVKLANFKVTILGEVKAPGIYNYYNNQTTILEALGKAKDLTDYGNRTQVLVVRPTVDGSKSYRVNLQDKALLASPEYFIQPNDVIYVPPLKAKGTSLLAQDYGFFITAISSTLTAVSLILTIILNVKN